MEECWRQLNGGGLQLVLRHVPMVDLWFEDAVRYAIIGAKPHTSPKVTQVATGKLDPPVVRDQTQAQDFDVADMDTVHHVIALHQGRNNPRQAVAFEWQGVDDKPGSGKTIH